MRALRDLSNSDLRELRTATREAIQAMAWFDLQVGDIQGLRQCGAEWSAASEVLRKLHVEHQWREKNGWT